MKKKNISQKLKKTSRKNPQKKYPRGRWNDSVNLRSPSPSPQGLTNDGEAGVQSVDGGFRLLVYVQ